MKTDSTHSYETETGNRWHRACKGELCTCYDQDAYFVRVDWNREH